MTKTVQEKFNLVVWDTPIDDKPFFLKWPVMTLRLLIAVGRDVQDGFLSLRATSLVYTTLLSLAPLLAISFAVLKGFGVHNQTEPFLKEFLSPLGPQGDEIAVRVVEFVDNIQVGVLGVVGVGLLILSVLSLMQKIEGAFNQIWNVRDTRSFILRVRDYLGALMIGPLFLFLSVGLTASLQHAEVLQRWLEFDIVSLAFDKTVMVIPYLLFALAFTALYMFMPNTRVRFVPALVAGVVTGVMWKGLGWLFGFFVAGSASYAAIYSAFAAIILLIFWLYIGWLAVLAGASLSYYLQYPSNQRLSRGIRHLSLRVKEKLALLLIAEIGRVFYKKEEPLTALNLSRRLRIPVMAVDDVLEDLVKSGILALTGKAQQQVIPGRPFDATSIHDMFRLLKAEDEEGSVHFSQLKPSETTDRILELSDRAARVVLGNITLKQLALGEVNA